MLKDGEQELGHDKIGVWSAIAAYVIWGFLPLYWKLLIEVPASQILAHRIWWSFIFVAVILTFTKRWPMLKTALSDKKGRLAIFASGFILSGNWFTYIWAVNQGRVIEASLGYYINPLLTICLGMLVLRERLNLMQLCAVILAGVGVIIQTYEFGKIPWIALILALTFAVYGLVKKMTKADSITGLALETLAVVPISLGYIIFSQSNGTGALGNVSWAATFILIGTGVATAIPLLFFGLASKRVPLSTMGFAQYLAPTISLFLGIFAFREPFTSTHILSFSFIWGALILYSLSGTSWANSWQLKLSKVKEKNA